MEKGKPINFYDIIDIQYGEKENEVKYILKNNQSFTENFDNNNKFVDLLMMLFSRAYFLMEIASIKKKEKIDY